MKVRIAITGMALSMAVLMTLAGGAALAAEEPYDVHVVLELSGGGAFIGNSERQAMELVEKTVNAGGGLGGRQIHFVFHDNQTNPQVSVQLANDVLATHPAIVIGPTILADCRAMSPLFSNGPVLICITPSFDPPKGSYLYSGDISTRSDAIAGMRYFRLQGWKRIAIMTSTDATGQDAQKKLTEIAEFPENKDVSLVAKVTFNPSDVSASAQIEEIKAANPQAVVAWSVGSPIATVFRGLRDAGLDIPVATSPGNEVYREMEQFEAISAEATLFLHVALARPGQSAGQSRLGRGETSGGILSRFRGDRREARPGFERRLAAGDARRRRVAQPRHRRHSRSDPELSAASQRLSRRSGFYDFEETPQRGLGVKNTLAEVAGIPKPSVGMR